MTEKTVIKAQQFECPKCNRNVTFKYHEIQTFADESNEPLHKALGRIIDYGQCQLAAEAAIPHHPIHSEIKDCPFYQALSAR